MQETAAHPLKILHVFRTPVGGLFRHVLDLAAGQAARGHHVGFVLDSTTGGTTAETQLAAIAPRLALGIRRIPMTRRPGPGDVAALRHIAREIVRAAPDVVHGHGAKGGAYARLTSAAPRAIRVYTPHGGSLNFRIKSIESFLYRVIERMLIRRTDLFLFESAFVREKFAALVAEPDRPVRVVCNGIAPSEFEPVTPAPDASDLLFIGELRRIKGVDVLIDAIAALRASGKRLTATIVGDGPDRDDLKAYARTRAVSDALRFAGIQPARKAFAMGRVAVVPSRAESLPYVVLEAAAAGLPLVATNVGAIPDVFGPDAARLIAPEDAGVLASALKATIDNPQDTEIVANRIRERVRVEFSLDRMVDGALDAYRAAFAARRPA